MHLHEIGIGTSEGFYESEVTSDFKKEKKNRQHTSQASIYIRTRRGGGAGGQIAISRQKKKIM